MAAVPATHGDGGLESTGNGRRFETDRNRWIVLSGLVAILCVSSIRDGLLLTRYSIPVGVDGYYYLVQIRSLLENGVLYYPSKTPLVLHVISGVARIGGNPLIAIKLTSIVFHGALTAALFVLLRSLTGSRWFGLLASVVSVVSVAHLTWISEFINQLGGITFGLWALASLVTNRKSKARWPLAAGLLAASFFSHRSMVLIVFTVIVLILILWLAWEVWPSRFPLLRTAIVVCVLACLPLVALIQPVFGSQLKESVSLVPQLPLTPDWFEEQMALLFLAPFALYLVVTQSPGSRLARYTIGTSALFALLFTLNPFLTHKGNLTTITERLDLLAYLEIAILLPGVVWLVKTRSVALTISSCVLALLLLGNKTLPIGVQAGFLDRRETLLRNLSEGQPEIPQGSIIIAPHGDQFLATFVTRVPAQNKISAAGPSQEVFWLLLGTPCQINEAQKSEGPADACSLMVSEKRPLFVTNLEKSHVLSQNPHLRQAPASTIDRLLIVRPVL